MFKVGLTGGIGSGKSTAAKRFQELGIPVIDADHIARQLVEPGQPALLAIQQQWGTAICEADGRLNRAKLRELIFSQPEQKRRLEALLHPLIFQTIELQIAQLDAPYCIIDMPLLFETGQQQRVDRILVVDCPVQMQLSRVVARSQLSPEQVDAIIKQQVSRDYRLAHADDVIDNGFDCVLPSSCLAEQVKKIHNLYLFLSNSKAFWA